MADLHACLHKRYRADVATKADCFVRQLDDSVAREILLLVERSVPVCVTATGAIVLGSSRAAPCSTDASVAGTKDPREKRKGPFVYRQLRMGEMRMSRKLVHASRTPQQPRNNNPRNP